MRRLFLHIAFWIVYVVQDIALRFLWDTARLPHLSIIERLTFAFQNGTILLITKILFTYSTLYLILPKLSKENNERTKGILYLIITAFTALLLYRGLATSIIYPFVYNWTVNAPTYFDPLSFLVALMDIGFASGAAIAIKQIRIQIANKANETNLIKEKLEAELKFLRNQINPHFLFNTLNNIYSLSLENSSATSEAIMKLSKLLRFMLYETKQNSIAIGNEVKLLEDYLELEKLRYSNRLTLTFIKEIDNDTVQISPSLLLPFVENAFKHGASQSRFESYIHIRLKLQKNLLFFEIENSKEAKEAPDSVEQIGLNNVKRQLELMYRDHDLRMRNEPNIYSIKLQINLSNHAQI